nr:MAG TPA: bromodomain protein [Caudoviricetes sp.]
MEKKEEFKKAIAQMSDEQLIKYLQILKFSLDEDISQFSHLSKYLRNP